MQLMRLKSSLKFDILSCSFRQLSQCPPCPAPSSCSWSGVDEGQCKFVLHGGPAEGYGQEAVLSGPGGTSEIVHTETW